MWDNALPSFLIGLREGLEAGLIVSVLVATLVRSGHRSRLPHVWTGVLAAIGVSMGFGAVLTFTSAGLSGQAQEAFGGTLSVVAVAFVTAMVFWMRRSARSLSGEIREKVTAALGTGAGVLIITSFLAVGREGLETALFLWTTGQTAGDSAGPLVGAGAGLVLAIVVCWGLYRRVLHLNLTRFFTLTGAGLIVIAAGVLGYGLRDLQESGVLPGATAYAVDLSASIDSGSWYATLLGGTLNLTPLMTWLQVGAYGAYLVVVMTLFVRGVRGAAESPPTAPGKTAPAPGRTARRSLPAWVVPVAALAVPSLLAGALVSVGDTKPASAATVGVSTADCGKGFGTPKPGQHTFQVRNGGDSTVEAYLINPATAAVYGEVEGIAPGTTRALIATIGGGSYAWRCVPSSGKAVTSAAVRVSGGGAQRAVLPVTDKDLAEPLASYRAYVHQGLTVLGTRTLTLQHDIEDDRLARARSDWLPAHVEYASLGAAYGTFGDFDAKINGRTAGLPLGVKDPGFTGFHRIEYGLWHGESAASLTPVARRLTSDVAALRKDFPHQDFDPGDLPLRTHEILEATLQQELTGATDYGSGSNLATAEANIKGTQELLGLLRPLISARDPEVLTDVGGWMRRTERIVLSARSADGRWTPVEQLPAATRQRLNGAMSQLLEELAPIPDLLEIRKAA
ncbi:iron permease FTR1 [Streptomyces lincolnensis]|uniref:Iron permease FTR1 n=1 Tax=Streptomyces lincolnensis TaxID=1915 RepID=A0A1B1M3P5_STRLN|nr:iron uptake transporter permease EfeU [Streptomyces lincolnensis]ANS63270.1 iron permease FTR1 [Streptomyces lincolnensis]AXG52193.1 iron permease FTR1 [Streptomyces lincolnensis]QMV05167.1 iron permease [Streptomyces lincolnensis]